jgi:hypothetical protein
VAARLPSRAINAAGIVLTLVALGFVAYQLSIRGRELFAEISWAFVLVLAASVPLLVALSLFLVTAWNRTLQLAGGAALDFFPALSIYGRSQLLKYVPANVFHVVGRYALLRSLGYEHRVIIRSTFLEFALIIATALALACIFAAPILTAYWHMQTHPVVVASEMTALAVVILFAAWRAATQRREGDTPISSAGSIATAILHYALYFCGFAAVALVLCAAVTTTRFADYFMLLGVVSGAFVAGLVTPGAPGGLGVREAIMLLALRETNLGSAALLVALGLRVATTVSDIFFALAGWIVTRRADQ